MSTIPSMQRSESAAMRVVEAVAQARNVDPGSLNPPLGSVIDPDAIDAVVENSPDSDVSLVFTYADCRVTVTTDDVDARPTAETGV